MLDAAPDESLLSPGKTTARPLSPSGEPAQVSGEKEAEVEASVGVTVSGRTGFWVVSEGKRLPSQAAETVQPGMASTFREGSLPIFKTLRGS